MPDIHLKFGGSTATRTLNCPAWPNVSELAPDIDRTSPAAERGTALHDIMELRYTDQPWDEASADMPLEDIEAIEIAYQAAEQFMDLHAIEDVIIEEMVVWDDDEIGGSADLMLSGPESFVILDWKFGHMPVRTTDQFALYLVAAMNHPEFGELAQGKRLYSVVIQPEVSHQAIVHEFTLQELATFEKDFNLAVKNSRTGMMDGNPGEWCKYCPGAGYCKAKKAQVVAFLDARPDDADDVFSYTVAQLEAIEQHVKDIKSEMMHRLEKGVPVAGYKLVEKQARRHWIDDVNALAVFKRSRLAKSVYLEPDKLRSPAQIEKAIKAAGKEYDASPLITKSSSGVTYAKANDKRAAIQPAGKVPDALGKILG